VPKKKGRGGQNFNTLIRKISYTYHFDHIISRHDLKYHAQQESMHAQHANGNPCPRSYMNAHHQTDTHTCTHRQNSVSISSSKNPAHMIHTHLVREDHPLLSRRRTSSGPGMPSSSFPPISSSSTFKNSEKKIGKPPLKTETPPNSTYKQKRSLHKENQFTVLSQKIFMPD
jgi:hypothetical protein